MTAFKKLKVILAAILVTSLLFCVFIFWKREACTPQSEEKKMLDKALRHLMILHHGIYTLVGTKPITLYEFILPSEVNPEDHEAKSYAESCERLWNEWFSKWKNYTGKRYLFFQEKGNGVVSGLFVNVTETAYVMHKYYPQFKKAIGYDFDPIDLVYQLPHDLSIWTRIEEDTFLLGVLFGFGEKNVYLFNLRIEGKIPFNSDLFIDEKEFKKGVGLVNKKQLTLNDLTLPQYIHFSPCDEVWASFKMQRKKIQELYRGKDFVEQTLLFLKSEEYVSPFFCDVAAQEAS